MKALRRMSVAVMVMCAVSGCNLPRGAAMQKEIIDNANAEQPNFAVYTLDSAFLPSLHSWSAGRGSRPAQNWLKGGAVPAGQVLAAGDTVEIAVWENTDNRLLTSPGLPSTALQLSRVSGNGAIFVPYVGPIKVSGLSPDAARERIQERVSEMVPAAQVQLNATPGHANSVDIGGGVQRPGNVPLTDRSLTVLGLVSQGGGALPSTKNPQLRLLRDGKVYRASLESLLDAPAMDVALRPGDKLFVEEDKRSFLSLGAAGRQEIVRFPQDRVNALEAVTLVGGINANRADPKGVLVLREYPSSAVRANSIGGPSQQRVVFTINLTTTDGLFSAQNFDIQDNDLVLATESPIVNTRTIIGLIGSSVGIANNADNIGN